MAILLNSDDYNHKSLLVRTISANSPVRAIAQKKGFQFLGTIVDELDSGIWKLKKPLDLFSLNLSDYAAQQEM